MTTFTPIPADKERRPLESTGRPRTRGLRLLCFGVDPELVRRLTTERRSEPPFVVTVASSATEAVTYVTEASVDCVVLGRGEEAERVLSQVASRNPSTPIVRWSVDGDPRKPLRSDGLEATFGPDDALIEEVKDLLDGSVTSIESSDRDDVGELRRSNVVSSSGLVEVAHDLNEPLRMVSSYVELIRRRYGDDLDEDAREFLEYAVEGTERMRDTIDSSLAWSRPGGDRASFEPVDFEDVLDAVLDDLAVAIAEVGATITAGPLPTVIGDPTELRRLLYNLVSNAIDHAGRSAPSIEIRADERADAWVFEVADDGVGIPPEEAERVFEPFVRGGQMSGTGIGLAVCEAVVDRHGGRIWIESDPRKGAKVCFSLPQ